MATKKQKIKDYFLSSNLMISKSRLQTKFNISSSYLTKILLQLKRGNIIIKTKGTKIKYYQRVENGSLDKNN